MAIVFIFKVIESGWNNLQKIEELTMKDIMNLMLRLALGGGVPYEIQRNLERNYC